MNRMYTLGAQVEVITDHEPLVSIYKGDGKPKQLRVDRHRTKLLPFEYTVGYEPGKTSPCDYGSRHPPNQIPIGDQAEEWEVENGIDIHVNRIVENNLPNAITMELLKAETLMDIVLQDLISRIGKYNRCHADHLKAYKDVFSELWTTNGILMRGNQVVLPKSLQVNAVGIAHEGHQGTDKTLHLLRQTCWFPGMRKMVLEYVGTCLPCNAAQSHNPPVPLQPNLLPDRPWQKLHCDFKGPIGEKYYLHIVIDQYSKYPEVDIVTSTSFSKLRPVLDRIFPTHGIPETVSSDNGPPYKSHEMEKYAAEMGFQMTHVTPDDPQCNGFAENFVKLMCKLIHTSITEGKDVRSEVYKYLLQYRATPHGTTGKSPAELLFSRKIQTKLPQMFCFTEGASEIRRDHDAKKEKQKQYFDKRNKARPKNLQIGDEALVSQQKSTTKPPFDDNPYTVTEISGNQVRLERSDGKVRTRDKNKIKKLVPRHPSLKPSWEKRLPPATIAIDDEFDYNEAAVLSQAAPTGAYVPACDDGGGDDETNGNDLFEIDDATQAKLLEMLIAAGSSKEGDMPSCTEQERPLTRSQAESSTEGDIPQCTERERPLTRSRGAQLQWNREMNPDSVLE